MGIPKFPVAWLLLLCLIRKVLFYEENIYLSETEAFCQARRTSDVQLSLYGWSAGELTSNPRKCLNHGNIEGL